MLPVLAKAFASAPGESVSENKNTFRNLSTWLTPQPSCADLGRDHPEQTVPADIPIFARVAIMV
jgi:hypothetical protein